MLVVEHQETVLDARIGQSATGRVELRIAPARNRILVGNEPVILIQERSWALAGTVGGEQCRFGGDDRHGDRIRTAVVVFQDHLGRALSSQRIRGNRADLARRAVDKGRGHAVEIHQSSRQAVVQFASRAEVGGNQVFGSKVLAVQREDFAWRDAPCGSAGSTRDGAGRDHRLGVPSDGREHLSRRQNRPVHSVDQRAGADVVGWRVTGIAGIQVGRQPEPVEETISRRRLGRDAD